MREASTEQGIKEQASTWIQQMNSGITAPEKQQLVAWINQNEQHHQAFVEQTNMLDNTNSINELSGVFPMTPKVSTSRQKKQLSPYIFILFSALFIAIFALMLQGKLTWNKYHANEIQRFQTLVGEQSTVTLSDGSELTLNTDTIVNVEYSESRRLIELVKGEALFDVAKDKRRPFVVLSGEKSFTALGTIFNIEKSNAQDMELIVTEGRVLVGDRQENNESQYLPTNTERLLIDQTTVVSAGKKSVIFNSVQVSSNQLNSTELNKDLAWQAGALIFNHEPLQQVLEEVSRYSHTQFEVTDPNLLTMAVSGYFKVDDIDGLLANLQNNLAIQYRHTSMHSIELSPLKSDKI